MAFVACPPNLINFVHYYDEYYGRQYTSLSKHFPSTLNHVVSPVVLLLIANIAQAVFGYYVMIVHVHLVIRVHRQIGQNFGRLSGHKKVVRWIGSDRIE